MSFIQKLYNIGMSIEVIGCLGVLAFIGTVFVFLFTI